MPEARIGVVGATGAVGSVTLRLLRERGYGNVRVFASGRSAGQVLDGNARKVASELDVGTDRTHHLLARGIGPDDQQAVAVVDRGAVVGEAQDGGTKGFHQDVMPDLIRHPGIRTSWIAGPRIRSGAGSACNDNLVASRTGFHFAIFPCTPATR